VDIIHRHFVRYAFDGGITFDFVSIIIIMLF
jgi:hypothetical protein